MKLRSGQLKIIVRTNSKKTEIVEWDEKNKAYRMNVKALPEKGRANTEIIKYFSKLLKKKVQIKSGLTSRTKTLKIL